VVVEPSATGPCTPKRLDADPQLLLELSVAAAYRLSHSEFLAWDATDRDKAIWIFLRQRQTCPHCGTRPEEWDPDVGGHRAAYVAEFTECQGCVVKGRKEAEPEMAEFRGLRVMLVRNEEAV
jgi:hypothetical protein